MVDNRRETGAQKLQADERREETDQNAALPKKPEPYGLTESVDDVDEKTRHSDGVNPPKGASDATATERAARAKAGPARDDTEASRPRRGRG